MKELITKGHEGTLRDNLNILYLDYGGNFMGVYTCQNSLNLSWVCFIVRKLCLNKADLPYTNLLFKILRGILTGSVCVRYPL